ncbi:UTRA domain-containing protein [Rhodospirillum sp. A1_3_36]|uniref:UTRA domain-containing protein n=1 Tax=Rhodospirillum sp. A1_3_36 TaxID=3391666 RepID=UPI0039A6A004
MTFLDPTKGLDPAESLALSVQLDGKGPLFAQVKRAFARRILDGALAVGDRLPSEERIAETLGVSRQTAHKAIGALAKEGFLVRRRKAGTFVAAKRRDSFTLPIPDIGEVVAERGGVYQYRILDRREVINGRDGLRWTDMAEGAPLLELEVLHLGDGVPLQVERRWINLAVAPDAVDEDFRDTPPGRWLADHLPWSTANHTVRAVGASAEMAALLEIDRGDACLLVERRTQNLGRPVTLVRFLSVGERYVLRGTTRSSTVSELGLDGGLARTETSPFPPGSGDGSGP